MSIPAFPLDTELLLDGHEIAPEDNRIRTPNSAGPPQMRRRFTAVMTPVRGAIRLDGPGLATFVAWYRDTLKDGSLTFSWTNPLLGGAATMSFVTPPRYRHDLPRSQGLTQVDLNLEIWP